MTPDALCPSCFAAVERTLLGDDGLCVACHYGVACGALHPETNPPQVAGRRAGNMKPYICDACHEQRDARDNPPDDPRGDGRLICEDCIGEYEEVPE